MKRFVFILCFIAATFVSASVFTSCKKDPQPEGNPKKALLIILDGWGIGDQGGGGKKLYLCSANATYRILKR